jgi:hypothetical protein
MCQTSGRTTGVAICTNEAERRRPISSTQVITGSYGRHGLRFCLRLARARSLEPGLNLSRENSTCMAAF